MKNIFSIAQKNLFKTPIRFFTNNRSLLNTNIKRTVAQEDYTALHIYQKRWASEGNQKKEERVNNEKTDTNKQTEKMNDKATEEKVDNKDDSKMQNKDQKKKGAVDKEENSSDEEIELSSEDIKKIKALARDQDKKLEESSKQLTILKQELRYSLAENENTIKRYKKYYSFIKQKREVDTAKDFAITKFAKDLLEIRDIMRLALTHADEKLVDKESDDNALKVPYRDLVLGVQMTANIFDKILKTHHVVEYDPMGEKFDPNLHDAVFLFEDASKTPNTVGQVIQSGWKINDRILRAAKVGTVKGGNAKSGNK